LELMSQLKSIHLDRLDIVNKAHQEELIAKLQYENFYLRICIKYQMTDGDYVDNAGKIIRK